MQFLYKALNLFSVSSNCHPFVTTLIYVSKDFLFTDIMWHVAFDFITPTNTKMY